MVGRGELTDAAWAQIAPPLSMTRRRGKQWADHRRVIKPAEKEGRFIEHLGATPNLGGVSEWRHHHEQTNGKIGIAMTTSANSETERRIVNPWTWQDAWGYVQGNEVTSPRRVLVCAGQLSTDTDGHLLHIDDMRGQIGRVLRLG